MSDEPVYSLAQYHDDLARAAAQANLAHSHTNCVPADEHNQALNLISDMRYAARQLADRLHVVDPPCKRKCSFCELFAVLLRGTDD